MCDVKEFIYITNFLNKVKQDFNFVDCTIHLKDGTKSGDNYVSFLSRSRVVGKTENGEEKNLDLIFKHMPTSELRRKMYNCEKCFSREIFMYETILPYFTKMEEARGIPEEKRFKYAKMYGANRRTEDKFIVLEDLSTQGYTLKDRTKAIDFDHCKIVMETIAQFHSFSFALRDQNPDMFKEMSKDLRNIFVTRQRNEEYSDEWKNGFQRLRYILGNDCSEAQKEKLEKYEREFLEYADMFDKPEILGDYGVIVHGDTWINNILFKYKEQKPRIAFLIDYQISSYSTPLLDIAYFIYMSTDKALREQHLDDLLHIYYRSLGENLAALDCDIQKVFPYDEFQKQIKKFSSYGFFTAVLFIHLFLGTNKDAFDSLESLSNPKVHAEKIWKKVTYDENYRTRLKDIFYEMCDRHYI